MSGYRPFEGKPRELRWVPFTGTVRTLRFRAFEGKTRQLRWGPSDEQFEKRRAQRRQQHMDGHACDANGHRVIRPGCSDACLACCGEADRDEPGQE